MMLAWLIVTVLLCALAFSYGYLRGLENLSSFESWGVGFDDGWKAAKEFFELVGIPVDLEEADELEEN